MELTPVIDSETFSALPDPIKECYAEDGDNHRLRVTSLRTSDGVLELANTGALRSALETERGSAKTANDKLRSLETRYEGIDPSAARDALSKVQEMDSWDPDQKLAEHKLAYEKQVKQDATRQIEQATAKHTAALTELTEQLEQRSAQLRQTMIISEGASAVAELKGNPTLLMPIIERMTDLVEHDDGTLEVVVRDTTGNVRVSPDTKRNGNMNIKELVSELRELPDYQGAFEGTSNRGGDIKNNSKGGPNGKNPWKSGEINLTEQMRISRENPTLAASLQAAAS